MMMTTTTVTATTTANTSSSSSVSFSSMRYLCQSSVESKNDKSLSCQEFLVESPDNSITIQAEVYSSPSKSLHTTQSVISTSDKILSRPISTCNPASNDPVAIKLEPQPLAASPKSQQDVKLSAGNRGRNTLGLVIGNRESSLTQFLYPDEEFMNAFSTAVMPPIPDTGVLMLDVIKLMPWSNIFCISSSPKKCVLCTKKMTVHFSYQSRGKSCIYDLEKKEMVHPYTINGTVQLAHNNCMGERANEGRNYFFKIFKEKSYFQRRVLQNYLITQILIITLLSILLGMAIYVTIEYYITIAILIILWVFIIFLYCLDIYIYNDWITIYMEYFKPMNESDRHLKLVIWKPLLIPTV